MKLDDVDNDYLFEKNVCHYVEEDGGRIKTIRNYSSKIKIRQKLFEDQNNIRDKV